LRPATVSQAGQDFWVAGEVFNEKQQGFFVDCGAADGLTISNTALLEQQFGWTGICIEADAAYYQALCRNRRATCIHACLDGEVRDVEFCQRQLLGGIVGTDVDNPPPTGGLATGPTIRLRTRTLAEILEACGAPATIDYLTMDVEGAEERILLGFPFERYLFRCLTIERPKPALRQRLARHGYVAVKEIPGLEVFYIHADFLAEYTSNVFAFWARPREESQAAPVPPPVALRARWWRRLVG
jgi:FkbM family methyltransferase